MGSYKGVIFDFDGVIFDSEYLHQVAQVRVLKEALHLPELTESDLDEYTGVADKEIFRRVCKKFNVAFDEDVIHGISQKKVQAYQDVIAETPEIHDELGIKSFLEFISTKTDKLAICSNSSGAEVRAVLKRLEGGVLQDYFKTISTIDRVAHGKPRPDGYLLAAEELSIDPKDCLVIEDSPTGATAAKTAGMTVIGLLTSRDADVLSMADYTAADYAEVRQLIAVNSIFT